MYDIIGFATKMYLGKYFRIVAQLTEYSAYQKQSTLSRMFCHYIISNATWVQPLGQLTSIEALQFILEATCQATFMVISSPPCLKCFVIYH